MSVKFTVAVAKAATAIRGGMHPDTASLTYGGALKADQKKIFDQRVRSWLVATSRPTLGYRMDFKKGDQS